MGKLIARTTQVLIDLVVLSAAFWLAFAFRFEGHIPLQMLKRLVVTWPYVVGFQFGLLVLFGVPRFAWRYVGMREAMHILASTGIASAVFIAARFLAGMALPRWGYAQFAAIPYGVILINFALAFLAVAGVRGARRAIGEHQDKRRHRATHTGRIPTLLIGAGQAGLMVAKEIGSRADLGILPVGFVDDDPMKVGTSLHGIRVLGTTADLRAICDATRPRQVLITIANAPGKTVRRLREACDQIGLPVKIIPGIYEIVGDKVNLTRIRNVEIEDLLGREPVQLDLEAIGEVARGKVVLVTGAGGSIGSELARQVARFSPARLVLLDRAENGLFFVERELRQSAPDLTLVPCIADICDAARMDSVFAEHRPALVLHAAAHKHVPLMEANPGEAVKNNVFGTRLLADLAHANQVGTFVMISTDKAVNPTSVMGTTKRIAEMYVQALSQKSSTRFVAVRFGNVLGSAGSVIPVFKEQIARGGPVTVTHPEMKRYFMTIPEACQLVLQAASMGRGGEIFILDMGEPVKIVDLARDLISLSGLRPGEDIEIAFSGMRPGEKLFEELSVGDEQAAKTRHPKIFIGRIAPQDYEVLQAQLAELRRLADQGRPEPVKAKFAQIVPEYQGAASAGAAPQAVAPIAAAS